MRMWSKDFETFLFDYPFKDADVRLTFSAKNLPPVEKAGRHNKSYLALCKEESVIPYSEARLRYVDDANLFLPMHGTTVSTWGLLRKRELPVIAEKMLEALLGTCEELKPHEVHVQSITARSNKRLQEHLMKHLFYFHAPLKGRVLYPLRPDHEAIRVHHAERASAGISFEADYTPEQERCFNFYNLRGDYEYVVRNADEQAVRSSLAQKAQKILKDIASTYKQMRC